CGRVDWRAGAVPGGAMSKRVYFFGLATAVVALAFVLADQLFWEPGVSAASVRCIRPGMHLKEVEKILGGRSIIDQINDEDERQQATAALVRQEKGKLMVEMVFVSSRTVVPIPEVEAALSRFPSSRVWVGQRGYATVEFDERARVKSARFYPNSQAGLLEQF